MRPAVGGPPRRQLLRLLACAVLLPMAAQAQRRLQRWHGITPRVLIDVRTPEEFAAGHLRGAVNIPYDSIAEGIATLPGLAKGDPVLLYCRSGRRSAIARQTLVQLGWRQVLDGGAMETLAGELTD